MTVRFVMVPHSSTGTGVQGPESVTRSGAEGYRVTMPDFAPLEPPRTVGDLFARHPAQFGLRGDHYLWIELREQLAERPLPDNRFDLRDILFEAWERAMGKPLSDDDAPEYAERFDPGMGMSAGQVLPTWWWRTGIPILVDRYCAFSGGS